jgi:hypothetical protein
MSNRFMYASDGYEPYKPLNNIDKETGQAINDPDELKRRKGPFFSCDNKNDKPHFHVVENHPEVSDTSDYIVRQMHVPGYDQHDAHVKDNFTTMPPFHIVTGWHVAEPSTGSHLSEFVATRKYDQLTDNDEARSLWKEECESLFGNGGLRKRISNNGSEFYEFMPGKEDMLDEQEQPEQQEQQEQEEQEQPEQEEQEEKTAPAKLGGFGLGPGEKAHSITFYPSKQYSDKIYPAFSRTKVYQGHANASEAQGTLLNHADRLDMINQIQNYSKSGENKDLWENLLKDSKKRWFDQ